jgi:hypothetical protein
LKCSLRSVYRMLAKVREKGPEGVLHGNRNKVSPAGIEPTTYGHVGNHPELPNLHMLI